MLLYNIYSIFLCFIEAADDFHYTNQGNAVEIEDISDIDEFAATRQAFSLLGLSTELQRSLLRVLAAILHLGNVTITQKEDDSQIKVLRKDLKMESVRTFFRRMCHTYVCAAVHLMHANSLCMHSLVATCIMATSLGDHIRWVSRLKR